MAVLGTRIGQDSRLTGKSSEFAQDCLLHRRVVLRSDCRCQTRSRPAAHRWRPTRHDRPPSPPLTMSRGCLGQPKIDHPFSLDDGGIGAWELAARYITVSLDSSVIPGVRKCHWRICGSRSSSLGLLEPKVVLPLIVYLDRTRSESARGQKRRVGHPAWTYS